MTKEILKRLFYSFLISFTVSMFFAWTNYQSTSGLEARQGMFLLVLANIGINIFNFVLSLTALLNLNKNVHENVVTSMLSFFLLPLGLLILLLSMFAKSKNEHETIKDFLLLGLPSIAFCIVLAYHFYRFRQTTEKTN